MSLSLILGRRRQGKSTLALSIALSTGKTVIIFDPNNQYEAIPSIDNLADFMKASGDDGKQAIGRIVAEPPIDEWQTIADELDGGSWRWGDYALIVDECSMLMNSSKVNPALERYIRTSPKDVDLILTTHRMVDVNPLLRALCTDWYFFQTHIDIDIEAMADNFGKVIAAKSTQLPNYQVLHFWLAPGGTPEHEVWDKPEEWYIDIGRTT